MTLTPFYLRPEWYTADRAAVQPMIDLGQVGVDFATTVPGVAIVGTNKYRVHRSHLPLMTTDPTATRLLLPKPPSDWGARDVATHALGFTLRPWQHQAIDFIRQRRGTLLGDEMRVGKTLSAIMSHDPARGSLVIICPAMVRPVWIGWLRRVFPDEPIGIFSGRTLDLRTYRHKLIVGHYDILPWWQVDASIGTLVFDEAHLLTNRAARRTKAAVFLASRAQRVIAATGTPIWNLPPNLWSVLGLVAPGAFGSYHEFAQRYGAPKLTAHGTQYTGISNEAELNLRLTDVMLRRRWVDVATTLPTVTRDVVLVEITPPQRRKLDLLTAGLKGAGAAIGTLARYREQTSAFKVAPTVAYAQTVLDRHEPLVIWTWHVSLAEKVAAALGDRARLLTGDTPRALRDGLLDEWRAAPALALVCTMAVAQVGLDFSHAHLAVFAEVDYTPAVVAQAEMRTYAPTRPMHLTYVVADHVVDQRVVLALARKLAAAAPVGVGAAQDSITLLQQALFGPVEEPDMDRLLAALLDA